MYSLKITTWENDGDNYKTDEIKDKNEDHILFYIAVARLFYCHGYKTINCFGNSDVEGRWSDYKFTKLDNAILEIVRKFQKQKKSIPEPDYWDFPPLADPNTEEFSSFFYDGLYDLVNTFCEGEYWRVVESYEVTEIPDEEPPKITEKFEKILENM